MNIKQTGGRAVTASLKRLLVPALLFAFNFAATPAAVQGQVPVLYTEGVIHGFVILKNMDGEVIADGDLEQTPKGNLVTSHVNFRFKDGSIQEETVVFSQRNHFRMLSDHLVQKGPAFKQPIDAFVDGKSGQVTVRYKEEDGKEKTISERLNSRPILRME